MQKPATQHGIPHIRELIEDLKSRGFSSEQIYGDTGLTPAVMKERWPEAPFEVSARFLEHAAEMTGDNLYGLHRGMVREPRRVGLLYYVGTSSASVLELLRNMDRFQKVFSDVTELDTSELEDTGKLTWWFRAPISLVRRQHVEYTAAGLLRTIRIATGLRIACQHVAFRHARNSGISEFEKYFGGTVEFGAPQNLVQFRLSDLSLPLITADNELHDVLLKTCEEALAKKAEVASGIIVRTEKAIVDRLASGGADQDSIAQDLGLSRRTFSRRLAAEGTSFQKVLEQLRTTLAELYLKDSDLPLIEIAFLLGYADVSSFSTAFKRWTGSPPGAYRR